MIKRNSLPPLMLAAMLFIDGCGQIPGGREDSLAIVKDGTPQAVIVLDKHPTRSAVFAATELREHVRLITGADLPVILYDGTKEPSVRKICVGESAFTRRLGLSNESFKPQEHTIQNAGDTLVLMGRDKQEGTPLRPEGRFGGAMACDNSAVKIDGCSFDTWKGSVELWVNIKEEDMGKGGDILRVDHAGHILSKVSERPALVYSTNDGKDSCVVGSKPLATGWRHVMVVFDGSDNRLEMFVDGVSQGKSQYSYSQSTNKVKADVRIGGLQVGQTLRNAFTGMVDELRLSNSVRLPSVPTTRLTRDKDTELLLHFDIDDLDRELLPAVMPDCFDETGTCYAVYEFLERDCGVRWFGPGKLGLCHPKSKDLVVSPSDLRRTPAFMFRWTSKMDGRSTILEQFDSPDSLDFQLFLRRIRAGGEPYACNHSFMAYYNRFQANPEFFAKGVPPSPNVIKGRTLPPQLCYTNPGLIRQVEKDMDGYFDGDQEMWRLYHVENFAAAGDYFGVQAMDNWEWCQCPSCKVSQLPPDERKAISQRLFSNGTTSKYWFSFINTVAAHLGKTHPGKFVSTLAYGDTAFSPEGLELEPNVSVQLCLAVRNWWSPATQANDLKMYDAWMKAGGKDRRVFLWLYYCHPQWLAMWAWKFNHFPGYFAHTLDKQFKMFAKDKVRGVFFDSILDFDPDAYVSCKLLLDPSLNVDALLDDYFQNFYGAAGPAMKEFYLTVEAAFSDPKSYPVEVQTENKSFQQTEAIAWGCLGTAERMRKLAGLMERAKTAAATPLEKRRVALYEKAVWSHMLEGRKKWEEKTDTPRPEVKIHRIPPPSGGLGTVDFSKAAPLSGWQATPSGAPGRKVEGRIAHDGKFLYVELVDYLPSAKLKPGSGKVWDGDHWELLLSRSREGSQPPLIVAVGPTGIVKKVQLEDQPTAAVSASDASAPDRWTVRAAIPLAEILAVETDSPTTAEKDKPLFLNVCRDTRAGGANLSWSPLFCSMFWTPARLGTAILAE